MIWSGSIRVRGRGLFFWIMGKEESVDGFKDKDKFYIFKRFLLSRLFYKFLLGIYYVLKLF